MSFTSSTPTAPQYYAKLMVQLPLWPLVSQSWALLVLPSTWMLQVANFMPMVLLLSRLTSLWVNRYSRLLFSTPASPMSPTLNR